MRRITIKELTTKWEWTFGRLHEQISVVSSRVRMIVSIALGDCSKSTYSYALLSVVQ